MSEHVRVSLYTSTEGGTFVHTVGLAGALDPQLFDIELITRPLGVESQRRDHLRRLSLAHVEIDDHEALSEHLVRRRPHVVHHFDSMLVLMALELAGDELGEQRPASVQLLHVNQPPRIPLDLADVIVGVSASALAYPGATTQLAGRGRVIDNGVPLRSAARAPCWPPLILSVNRLVPDKRVDDGLRALARLEPRPWTHRIIGDGSARPQLEALARALGLAARVEFCGALADPLPHLPLASVFLSSSASEGFGLALAEAAEAGLAIVARRAGGLTAELVHERHALLYDDPRELPELLARVLDDAALRQELGRAARALIHERFSLATMVAGYTALYLELAGRPPASSGRTPAR